MIVRKPNAARHCIIDRSVLIDPRLTWSARGVLAFLLAFEGSWEKLRTHLRHASADEQRVVNLALRELVEFDLVSFEDEVAS